MARRKNGNGHTPSKRVNGIKKELLNLRDDFAQLTKQFEGLGTDSGDAALDQLKGRLDSFATTVDGMISDVGDRGREAIGAANDFRGDMVEKVEDAVRERPFATIALAIGLGFVLSSTMRR